MSEQEKKAEAADAVQQAAAEEQPEENGKKKKKEKVKRPLWLEILSWVWTILIALLIALVVRSAVFEPVRVDGHSMDDTLADKEIMLVTKFDYNSIWFCFPWQNEETKENAARLTLFGNPKRFDVVICRYPDRGDTNFVKRVIGLPGDAVKLENGRLYVNGTAYEEPYVSDDYRTGSLNMMEEYTVPKKGDTFAVSFDGSRYIFLLNGERWPISNSVMKCRDENGKQLTVRDSGRTFVYDGVTCRQEDADYGEKVVELLNRISDKAFTVDEDHYFVMGDHRNNSNDSRSQGAIERSMIIGHVRQVLFPFGKWRSIPNGLEVK